MGHKTRKLVLLALTMTAPAFAVVGKAYLDGSANRGRGGNVPGQSTAESAIYETTLQCIVKQSEPSDLPLTTGRIKPLRILKDCQ